MSRRRTVASASELTFSCFAGERLHQPVEPAQILAREHAAGLGLGLADDVVTREPREAALLRPLTQARRGEPEHHDHREDQQDDELHRAP